MLKAGFLLNFQMGKIYVHIWFEVNNPQSHGAWEERVSGKLSLQGTERGQVSMDEEELLFWGGGAFPISPWRTREGWNGGYDWERTWSSGMVHLMVATRLALWKPSLRQRVAYRCLLGSILFSLLLEFYGWQSSVSELGSFYPSLFLWLLFEYIRTWLSWKYTYFYFIGR